MNDLERRQQALARIEQALGYAPETSAVEWVEAVADACASPEVAKAISEAYARHDVIGWSRQKRR